MQLAIATSAWPAPPKNRTLATVFLRYMIWPTDPWYLPLLIRTEEPTTISLAAFVLLLGGKLSCLQEINAFFIREESGYKINELGNLRSLCKLCIRDLENVNNSQEAKEARLSEKEYLKELDLR